MVLGRLLSFWEGPNSCFFGEGSCIPSSEKMDPSADGIFTYIYMKSNSKTNSSICRKIFPWYFHVNDWSLRNLGWLSNGDSQEMCLYRIGSMYGIFTYIYHINQPNVGKYTIHGSYGYIYIVIYIIPPKWGDPETKQVNCSLLRELDIRIFR